MSGLPRNSFDPEESGKLKTAFQISPHESEQGASVTPGIVCSSHSSVNTFRFQSARPCLSSMVEMIGTKPNLASTEMATCAWTFLSSAMQTPTILESRSRVCFHQCYRARVDFLVRFGTRVILLKNGKAFTFDVNPSGNEIAKPPQEQIATLVVSSNHGQLSREALRPTLLVDFIGTTRRWRLLRRKQ
jgi:hypothetical protein